jgi:hypothetical protein
MADADPRDLELAKKALIFVLSSEPKDVVANVAKLFALARTEGKYDAVTEMKVRIFETPLSRDAKTVQ